MVRVAREIGAPVIPDAKYVQRLEAGDIKYPGPAYRDVLAELCGRPLSELGFSSAPKFSLAPEGPSADNRMNTMLRNAIMASGLELPQIARRVGVNPKSVERWITRGVVPHPRHRWKVCEVLGRDESELWPDAVSSPESKVHAVQYLDSDEADISDSQTPEDEERIIRAARKPRRHDPGVIDALSTVLNGQRRLEDAIGSEAVIGPVKAQLAIVKGLVTEARGDLRPRVVDIGSQWAQFSGWLHANTGWLGEANRLYGMALEWAVEADSPNMLATALNMQGHVAWLGGNVGPMLGLSRAAQRGQRISPGVRALAVQQEARAMALSGEAKISDLDRKLDEAAALVTQAAEKPEEEPPWIYFFSPDYLIMQRGLAYRLLGHYEEANELLSEGLAAIPSEMRKTEWVASHYLLQLAATNAKAGDISRACELIREANLVATQTASARLRKDLAKLSARMAAKWADNPDVIELAELLRYAP
jgi:transcriptional regulator with XRE-family HTH domain